MAHTQEGKPGRKGGKHWTGLEARKERAADTAGHAEAVEVVLRAAKASAGR